MADNRKYLIGRGESLTTEVSLAPPFGEKKHPYKFTEAKKRLKPNIQRTSSALRSLPDSACPNDEAVAILTLHPSYLAKSYFPEELLGALGLRSLGSRGTKIKPEKVTSTRQVDKDLQTVELYAAGKRAYFDRWSKTVLDWTEVRLGAEQLRNIETVYAESPENRLQMSTEKATQSLYEAVLHVEDPKNGVIEAFEKFVKKHHGKVLDEQRILISGLCFLPVQLDEAVVDDVAAFTFMRSLRDMPQMRSPSPFRSATPSQFSVSLPEADALNPHIRVAVFDGGLPDQPDLTTWVSHYDADKVGPPTIDAQRHGLGVTSSLLYGPLRSGAALERPFTTVDHYRVAGQGDMDPDYYTVLFRIADILQGEHYDYISVSLGPTVNLDVNNLHAWTAILDDILSHGKTLAFFAVGNDGHRTPPRGPRLSSPADVVNGLGVGACNTCGDPWERSDYSSIGPGRSPGAIKPDIVCFGGSASEEFGMLTAGTSPSVSFDQGTSYATPLALRTALGAATYFGHALRPLAVKALLIHHAHRLKHPIKEVGWGRIPQDYEDLVLCQGDEVHIVYQGVLQPAKSIRAPIPVPPKWGNGPVSIKATICFATPTEANHPSNYTNAGLEVFFRPHEDVRKKATQRHPDTSPFFQKADLKPTEAELRDDAQKWETTRSREHEFDPDELKNPVFDIHYIARTSSGKAVRPQKIPYAMIVTVRQRGMMQLYDNIVARYRTQLQALQPSITVPIRL